MVQRRRHSFAARRRVVERLIVAVGSGDPAVVPADAAVRGGLTRAGGELPGVGHFPQVEAPTEVVELIEDFIAASDLRDSDSPQPSF